MVNTEIKTANLTELYIAFTNAVPCSASFLSSLSLILVAKIMEEIICQNKGKTNQGFMVGIIQFW